MSGRTSASALKVRFQRKAFCWLCWASSRWLFKKWRGANRVRLGGATSSLSPQVPGRQVGADGDSYIAMPERARPERIRTPPDSALSDPITVPGSGRRLRPSTLMPRLHSRRLVGRLSRLGGETTNPHHQHAHERMD